MIVSLQTISKVMFTYDYDVLFFILIRAGWSHFAQFTIAVVNKDPKKSKYSGWFIGYAFLQLIFWSHLCSH